MNHLTLVLKKILDDHHMIFFTGVMFIVAGLVSLLDNVIETILGREIEFFHGMMFLGVFNLCMSLVFMVIGAKNIEAAEAADTPSDAQRIAMLEQEIDELRAVFDSLKKNPS